MLDSLAARGVMTRGVLDDHWQVVQDTDTYSSCVSADSHVGTVPVMAFECTWSSLMQHIMATQPVL
jgi:hypothetical protein